MLITQEGGLTYFTNFLHEKEAKEYPLWKVLVSNINIFHMIKVYIKKLNLRQVGFEAKLLPFLEYKKIKENLSLEGINFLETIDLIESLRAVKSAREIVFIKKSVAISEEAFAFVREIYDHTMTEKSLSIEIERFLKLKGDNSTAFAPIIAGGRNSAYPHHQAAEVSLSPKNILIDLGSKYCGYCADLTRVYFWGKMPVLYKKIYDIVKAAGFAAIEKIREGRTSQEVDKAGRSIIEKKGYAKFFGHGLGHGVGLCVHEQPYLGPRSNDVLKEGMVLTIEPAVYIPGKWGIRIENMVLVKKDNAEVLSGNADW